MSRQSVFVRSIDAPHSTETIQLVSAPNTTRKWTLTQEAFDQLLASFAPDRDAAAQKYLEVRENLIRLFVWRGCPFPEDHADETFNRVARKISEGEEIRNAPAYVIGVARLLVFEIIKAQSKQRAALDEWQKSDVREDTVSELRIECLQRCLGRLSPENRELILQYYQGDKRAKIENRKQLCFRRGLAINSLRMRVLRLREQLQTCCEECLNHC
jgi:DNA-directed RNA polymerase specialized sigma24 family protein